MGSNLIHIFIRDLIDSPISIDSAVDNGDGLGTYISEYIDLTNLVDEFSVQVAYDNGSGLDCDIIVEVTNDKVLHAEFQSINKTDPGTAGHFFDASGTGAAFMRVKVVANSGTLDLSQILFRGKKRR
jgi:hypothetical protein